MYAEIFIYVGDKYIRINTFIIFTSCMIRKMKIREKEGDKMKNRAAWSLQAETFYVVHI